MTNKQTCELSIITPTFNESGNVHNLIDSIRKVLKDVKWEIIFVDDDSPDQTAAVIRAVAQSDGQVRCIQRIGRRGLSSACVEGMLASAAPYIAVIDADLQHDETLLPMMLQVLKKEQIDIVVGSRYIEGGEVKQWNKFRLSMSRLATSLSRLVLKTNLKDPMSGYFMMHRTVLERVVRRLSNIGFKILLDIIASSKEPLKIKELPYQFRNRSAGQSKLDNKTVWDFFMLLCDKRVGRYVPARLISFCLIGGFGVIVHLIALVSILKLFNISFEIAQTTATLVAMIGNFYLNNALTYRDKQLKGLNAFYGLAIFVLTCSVGIIANVGVASSLFSHKGNWLISALPGILISTLWNYIVTAFLIWDREK